MDVDQEFAQRKNRPGELTSPDAAPPRPPEDLMKWPTITDEMMKEIKTVTRPYTMVILKAGPRHRRTGRCIHLRRPSHPQLPGRCPPKPLVAEASHDQSPSSGPAMSHLGMLSHYPKPEYRETMLHGFLSIAKIMNAQPGVESSTYEEVETGALVAVTKYESLEAIQAGFRAVAAAGIDPEPKPDRESRPRELHRMILIQGRD